MGADHHPPRLALAPRVSHTSPRSHFFCLPAACWGTENFCKNRQLRAYHHPSTHKILGFLHTGQSVCVCCWALGWWWAQVHLFAACLARGGSQRPTTTSGFVAVAHVPRPTGPLWLISCASPNHWRPAGLSHREKTALNSLTLFPRDPAACPW